MAAVDLPLDELRTLRLTEPAPQGLAEFWQDTLIRAGRHPLLLGRTEVDTGLRLSRTFDLRFSGFDGQPVHAWLQVPAAATGPLPAVVQYHGYSTTRPVPLGSTWVEAGYAHLQMDNRGQGWYTASLHELTPDQGADAGASAEPGLMTRGVQSPEGYYYRRLVTDAFRLLQLAAELDEVAADRVLVTGGSQGGGLSIAAAALAGLTGQPLAGAMPDVPFLCSFRRAVDVATEGPYPEIERWLRARPQETEAVFHTLAHVDGVHLAAWARCPALFSVALRDPVCPPSTVFQAFNAWAGDKQIEVYPFNEHEGGREIQLWKQVRWANAIVGDPAC